MKRDGMTIFIPVHANRDIPKGTLNKLLKDGGLK
jgi:predicted RNA binding protein YcfA (HicA-like mRNA interferase family)